MRVIGFEENKSIQKCILTTVSDFCNENNLTYFLGYGTLIGAIRHNGFIPWDDDIDILMPREDYNKLIETFNLKKRVSYVKLISPFDDSAKHPIVKIIDTRTVKIEKGLKYKSADDYLGIDIDIFPLDGQPEKETEFIKWRKKLVRCYRAFTLMNMNFHSLGGKSKIEKLWMTLYYRTPCKALKLAAKLHSLYPYEKSDVVGVCESSYVDEGDRVNKECYQSSIEHLFEGGIYKIPVGYDRVLRNIYGDYMQLPPVEKQVTHHDNNVFWKE